MTPAEELDLLDAEWDQLSAPPSSREPVSEGAFGHATERRLGLRVPAACWALLKDGERSVYARTVEISPTGAVVKLLDESDTRLNRGRSFELDIFVPGASRPVHAVARPARTVGQLEAFEFSRMSPADRLTLAEHLDHLVARRPNSNPPPSVPRSVPPPVSWKNFVLSLKHARAPASVQRP